MLNLYNRTIGRIDKGYIFSHYLSVYFVIFILYNFTDKKDGIFCLILCVLALFYPFATFGWDYLFQSFNSSVFFFTGFTFILWIFWKISKFFFLLTFAPLIAIVVLFFIYLSGN